MGFFASLGAMRPEEKLDPKEEWRRRLRLTSKEDTPPPRRQTVPGGSWGRGTLATDASFKRLLEAMRSWAPGGWTDDRWEQTKHFVGIAYVGIHRVCTHLSMAEFAVLRKDRYAMSGDGLRPVSPDDPAEGDRRCRPYDLVRLLEKPNRRESFGKMMYKWGQQKRLSGTALTWVVPNRLGVPYEIYSIPTAIAIPQPVINPDYPEGFYRIQPVYPYGPFSSYPTPSTSVGAPIPAEWMLRFQYPHPLLQYDGYSPMTAMRLHMDVVEMVDRSRFYAMKKSVNPSAIVNFGDMEGSEPLRDEEISRIHAEWENSFQGPENHGNLIVGMPGGKIEQWGTKPNEMDYPKGWEQLTGFILGGGFGITKPAAGMVETSHYATLWASLRQLQWETLEPECEDIGFELTNRVAPFFGDDLVVKIRTKPLDDVEQRLAKLTKGLEARAVTKNEVRKELGYPLTTEEWGNDLAGDEPGDEVTKQAMALTSGSSGNGSTIDDVNKAPVVEGSRPDTPISALGALGGSRGEGAPKHFLMNRSGQGNGHSHNGNGFLKNRVV